MITSDNYIVCYVLSTKTYHNSQPSTLNSQIASTLNSKLSTCLNLSQLVLLVQEERSIVTVLPFPCKCLSEAIYEYHLYVTVFL